MYLDAVASGNPYKVGSGKKHNYKDKADIRLATECRWRFSTLGLIFCILWLPFLIFYVTIISAEWILPVFFLSHATLTVPPPLFPTFPSPLLILCFHTDILPWLNFSLEHPPTSPQSVFISHQHSSMFQNSFHQTASKTGTCCISCWWSRSYVIRLLLQIGLILPSSCSFIHPSHVSPSWIFWYLCFFM